MAPEKVIVEEGDQSRPPDLRFVHFNDVYHVEPSSKDPCGGIARFQTLCDYYRKDTKFSGLPDLITVFSGDAFNPSLESSVTKGSHMVPVLNNIGVDVACVGNHDFDFGIPQFRRLTKQNKFPWLLSNIFEQDGKTVLGKCPPTHLITSSNGIKIGFIGIAEQEWIATVNALPPDLPYMPSSEAAGKYAAELREQGAEMIIAICHQREVNDNRLAEEVAPGTLDLILAGHDHDYRYSKINGCHVFCSGSDFKQLSYVEARRKPDNAPGWDFTVKRRDITKEITEDQPTVDLLDRLFADFRTKLEKPIGYTSAPLDARFSTVRKSESNYANFVADLLRNYWNGDCAILVGGTVRGDQIYTPGVIRIKDIMDCFPFEDPDVMVRTPGRAIRDALENGVSKWPALEGRFCQVSNIQYKFDPSKPPGSRILSVNIGGVPLEPDKEYKLVTRSYTISGGDGFTSLRLKSKGGQSTYIIDEEHGSLTSTVLRQYFMSLKVLRKWKQWTPQLRSHWDNVSKNVHRAHPVKAATERPQTSSQPPTAPGSPTLSMRQAKRQKLDGDAATVDGDTNPAPAVVLNEPGRTTSNAASKGKAQQEEEDGAASDSDEDDGYEHEEPGAVPPDERREREKRTFLARKVLRRWRRAAGIRDTPGLCEGEAEGVHWTHGIAPRIEGRIEIVGHT